MTAFKKKKKPFWNIYICDSKAKGSEILILSSY